MEFFHLSLAFVLQRAFVGVDTFSVFQEIILRGTDDPRVCNIVRFSEAIGELKVEVLIMVSVLRIFSILKTVKRRLLL